VRVDRMRDSTRVLFALSASRATPRRGAMDARAPRASPRGFASRGAASTSTSTRDDVDARRGGARATTRDAVGDDGFGLRRARGKRARGTRAALAACAACGILIARARARRARRARAVERARRAGRAFAEAAARVDAGDAEAFASVARRFARALREGEGDAGARESEAAFERAASARWAALARDVDAAATSTGDETRDADDAIVARDRVARRRRSLHLAAEEPEVSSSSAAVTTSMCDEDRALLREELELRKAEVGLKLVAMIQKQTSNALKAEGNKLAADGAAETKAEREERRAARATATFHGATCDALAVGLVTTCAMMLSLGRREVVYRFGQLTTICGGSMTSSSSFVGVVVAPFETYAYVKCVANEGARAAIGFFAIAAVALLLTKLEVSRRFAAAPMFVLALVLGVGVGAVGVAAVRALGGDPTLWLLAWRLYLTSIACVTVSAPAFARSIVDRAPRVWAYYAVFGVLLPALVAASAFAAADAESLRAVLARALFGASSPRASSPVYFV